MVIGAVLMVLFRGEVILMPTTTVLEETSNIEILTVLVLL
jgi:hypothetical protein